MCKRKASPNRPRPCAVKIVLPDVIVVQPHGDRSAASLRAVSAAVVTAGGTAASTVAAAGAAGAGAS